MHLAVNAAAAPRDIDGVISQYAAKKLGIKCDELGKTEILSKSVDSRKGTPVINYKLALELPEKLQNKYPQYTAKSREELLKYDVWKNESSPIVVGTGPAGLFAALSLAAAGAKPLVLDRGFEADERVKKHEKFLQMRELDCDSNLLIGEGGAGTFSDGKLYTGTRSPFARMVIEEFIKCGAPEEIGYLSRPHIGSDKLKEAIPNLRKRIISLGGVFRFNAHVTDIINENGVCRGVVLADGEKITTDAGVILACGLGGRELIKQLIKCGAGYELKSFQIGCRIEHPQDFIDLKQYKISRPESLGAAEYHIVSRPANALGVSSFCMCPGGKVVNATAWQNRSITNGMSNFARDGKFANSCLIATLDLKSDINAIYNMMEHIESELFVRGGKDYAFPCQRATDFLCRRSSAGKIDHDCETGVVAGRIDDLLPRDIYKALAAALKHFDKLMPGFIRYGNFIGVESCVSSPVRLLRAENGENTIKHLFPSGEGPGLAGGIISAACDGLRTADNLLKEMNK